MGASHDSAIRVMAGFAAGLVAATPHFVDGSWQVRYRNRDGRPVDKYDPDGWLSIAGAIDLAGQLFAGVAPEAQDCLIDRLVAAATRMYQRPLWHLNRREALTVLLGVAAL